MSVEGRAITAARSRRQYQKRLMVLAVAAALDLMFGEPPARIHPVNWIGGAITALERPAPARGGWPRLLYGALCTLALAGAAFCAGRALDRVLNRLPAPARLIAQALLLKPAFALRMLLSSGAAVETALAAGDLAWARAALTSLVSRPTADLSAEACAAAAVESLAENTTDSVVGPWMSYAFFGLAGAWTFRAINTLDSRWGYHGVYEWLGRSAAKLDDLGALVPARVSAILLIAGTALAGGDPRAAVRSLVADHARTASPNAGWTMSVMAGGLGRRLEKAGQYTLNAAAPDCSAADIGRARRVVAAAACIALGVAAAGALFANEQRGAGNEARSS